MWVENTTGLKSYVIEGFSDIERCMKSLDRLNLSRRFDGSKTIVYTGTLATKYGVLDLVRAFRLLKDQDCNLIICGSGDADSEIKDYAAADSRIRFLGIVHNELAKTLQNEATVLVNPRKPEGEYTAYSFPSKTMEYLETGNIVVSYRLPGIPKEYEGKICFVEDSSTLQNALQRALDMTFEERIKVGKAALSFLLNEKGPNTLKAAMQYFGWDN